MSKYVIELESIKHCLLILQTEQPSSVALEMKAAEPGGRSVVAITSDQFKLLGYDIEGHAQGKYGISKPDVLIWVRDVETNEVEKVDFATALRLLGSADDDAALAAQEAAAKKAADRLKAKQAEATPETGNVFTPVSKLTET